MPLAFAAFGCLLVFSALAYYVTVCIGETNGRLYENLFPFAAAAMACSAIVFSYLMNDIVACYPMLRTASLFLGRISYPVYLFHLLFLVLLSSFAALLPNSAAFWFYIVVLIAFGALFYQVFEKPILAARPNFPRALRQYEPVPARAW